MKSFILAIALAYVHAANAAPPAKEPVQDGAHQEERAPHAGAADNIGHATMLKDRTIVLSLIYWFPGGGHTTPAEFRYKPGDPEYKEVLRHLGGIEPGESKGVKPWPGTGDPVPDFKVDLTGFKDYQWPETSGAPDQQ